MDRETSQISSDASEEKRSPSDSRAIFIALKHAMESGICYSDSGTILVSIRGRCEVSRIKLGQANCQAHYIQERTILHHLVDNTPISQLVARSVHLD